MAPERSDRMVTRVRIEAEGKTPADVVASLDWASQALGIHGGQEVSFTGLGNVTLGVWTTNSAIPEIAEEVIERRTREQGTSEDTGVYYAGRRVVKLYPVYQAEQSAA